MDAGPHAELISPYFKHMKDLLVAGIVLGDVDVASLHKVTAKSLYTGFTSSFPPPKVEFKYEVDWSCVWKRVHSPMLEPKAREIMFMIVNNIVANRDRLFSKFNMVPSPLCVLCQVLHDNVHLFCECELVRESWFWIRQRILGMFSVANGRTSNFELLNLMFESCVMDSEVIWILGIYVQLVWKIVICKKKMLKLEVVKSEFALKFGIHQNSNLPTLAHIVGLLD